VFALGVEGGPTAGIEQRIVFKHNDCRFNCVNR
jgi:hypothetical protein